MMLLRAPSGNVCAIEMWMGSAGWGPYAAGVGGAQPGAERL
jgi:hypothetical protein